MARVKINDNSMCSASELQVYSPSLHAPTQPPLVAEERGAQSLQCLTESTSQDDLAQISVSTLKRIMQKHGIHLWPFRNKKIECSLFEPKLVTEFVHGAVGSFSPPTSSHTDVVGSSYPNSQGSKPPKPRIKKKMSSSFGGQAKIEDQMLVRNLSAHEGQLQEQNRFHLHRQDARIVTLRATYRKLS
ncbi:unnamed protein product [Camellia sinensis]